MNAAGVVAAPRTSLARVGRLTVGAVSSFALAVALVAVLVLAVPSATGYRSLTVLTGSMQPTLEPGSVVVDEIIAPTEVRIGDIVTFTDPENPDRLITHRLKAATIEGDTARMVTRGDANDAPERWSVPVDGEIGRVVVNVPKLGHVQALAGSRNGYLVLMILVVLLGAWILLDVWRSPKPDEES